MNVSTPRLVHGNRATTRCRTKEHQPDCSPYVRPGTDVARQVAELTDQTYLSLQKAKRSAGAGSEPLALRTFLRIETTYSKTL